jgi:hypothetical protein
VGIGWVVVSFHPQCGHVRSDSVGLYRMVHLSQ